MKSVHKLKFQLKEEKLKVKKMFSDAEELKIELTKEISELQYLKNELFLNERAKQYMIRANSDFSQNKEMAPKKMMVDASVSII